MSKEILRFGVVPAVGLALILSSSLLSQSGSRSELLARIDESVDTAMERDHIVGTSIGVRKSGEVIVAKGYGYADLENDVRATEHTVYRIGSITKQFTAASIMKLVEAGELSLDDELTKFLPDYPAAGHKITIDRLLNHTSGIKGYTEMEAFSEVMRDDLSQAELIALFSAEPFEFAPGEKYQYNNSAYYLLGVLIEKVTGQTYEGYLHENIWEPLGMLESHYLDNSPIVRNRADGYEFRQGRVVNDDPLSMRLPYSAGSLGSSVSDLFAWQAALLSNRVVSESSYERMITPGTLNSGKKLTYGYGLSIGEMEGHRKISHGGGINGFRTHLSYYPDDDLTVIVLSNTGSANPAALESEIARAVLGIATVEIQEVDLTTAQLEMYAGTYDPGRGPIPASVRDDRLFMMGRALRPIGDHRFVSSIDPHHRVTFSVEGDRAVSVRIEREGQVIEAPRVP